MLKVNLGAGPGGIDGWVNYDWGLLPWVNKIKPLRMFLIKLGWLGKEYELNWPEFKLVDIRKRLPLKNESVDFLYCSQVLEHFEIWQVEEILREIYRVLRAGGLIRISIPDAEKVIKIYQKDGDINWLNELVWGYQKGKKQNLVGWLSEKFIRGHKWLGDSRKLEEMLTGCGFKKIRRVDFRKGEMPDIERLDLKCHKKSSLYIEASK